MTSSPSPSLSSLDVKLINFCDQVFWETGKVPTPDYLANTLDLSVTQVNKSLDKLQVQKALKARGLPPVGSQDPDGPALLTTKQLILANLLMNAHDKRSVRQKLEEVQVSSQQYHAWLRQPGFANYLRKRAEYHFAAADATAYEALVKNIEDGDTQAIKLFFEMRNIHNPRLKAAELKKQSDIATVVRQIIQILSKHLADSPEKLLKISDDILKLDPSPSPPTTRPKPLSLDQTQQNAASQADPFPVGQDLHAADKTRESDPSESRIPSELEI